MNRKGAEGITIGAIIMVFVGVIFGLVILTDGISNQVASITQTATVVNSTQTFPAAGANLTLTGQLVSDFIATNSTDGVTIGTGNYTIYNMQLLNGELTALLEANTTPYNSQDVNLSYTYEPFGYQTNSGSRALLGLIIIFAALAIAVFALVPTLRSGVLQLVSR